MPTGYKEIILYIWHQVDEIVSVSMMSVLVLYSSPSLYLNSIVMSFCAVSLS